MKDAYLKDESNERVKEAVDRDRGWWIWALLLPLFFFGGWQFNEWWRINDMNTKTQYGVGGAPDVSSLSEQPRVESPVVIEPSPFSELDDERDSTPSPSPADF